MLIHRWSPLDLAWFAGLFEGEGSILFRGDNASRISISMTDLDILDRVQKIFGGTVVAATRSNMPSHWKNAWIWTLSSEKSYDLLTSIRPLLGERRGEKADQYLKSIDDRRLRAENYKVREQTIVTLKAEGYSLRAIGKMLNMDHGLVGRIVRKSMADVV